MIKHYLYYFSLAILAMCAVDIVLDNTIFIFALYFLLGWGIPPCREFYVWTNDFSKDKWISAKLEAL